MRVQNNCIIKSEGENMNIKNANKLSLYSGRRENVGERLKQYMNAMHLKQKDILDKVKRFSTNDTKITKTDLSQYINGKTEPRSNKLHILAQGLQVDEAWLMGFGSQEIRNENGKPVLYEPIKKNPKELPSNIEFLDKHNKHLVRIPILGDIACGEPILAEQNIEGYTTELFDTKPEGTLFALHCEGDSMEPKIPNGANVIVRLQPTVENDEIAAVLIDDSNSATIKRVKYMSGQTMLIPENDKYDPILLNKNNPGHILGKVIKVTYDL